MGGWQSLPFMGQKAHEEWGERQSLFFMAEILNRRDIQVQASVLVQRAERAISKANPPKPEGGPGRGIKTVTPDHGFSESVSGDVLRHMRAVHSKLTDKQFEARTVEAIESETPLTRQSLKSQQRPYTKAINTGNNEWYTPAEYLEAAREVLGGFDLDPASSGEAQKQVKAGEFFDKEHDGLAVPWRGRVWLNSPYAQPLISEFVRKLMVELHAGRVTDAVMLTHNYTDTAWFHEAASASAAICFTRGRVKFVDPAGKPCSPTQGQTFFYFGSNSAPFVERFSKIGFVVVRPGEVVLTYAQVAPQDQAELGIGREVERFIGTGRGSS